MKLGPSAVIIKPHVHVTGTQIIDPHLCFTSIAMSSSLQSSGEIVAKVIAKFVPKQLRLCRCTMKEDKVEKALERVTDVRK